MLQKLGRDLPQHHLKLDKVRAELQKRVTCNFRIMGLNCGKINACECDSFKQ